MDKTHISSFTWIVLGDIHGETENLDKIPELSRCDGIIISGDLTNLGGIPEAQRIMKEFKAHGVPVLAQIGNMDKPEINGWLNETGINLHVACRNISEDTSLLGLGGSTPTPFNTPSEFPEEQFAEWLKQAWASAKQYGHQVIISHNPPLDTKCDIIPGGTHVGSNALREFIEDVQPDLCICGHIHESRGCDTIGHTKILNPGPLSEGGYVVLKCYNGQLDAEIKDI